MKYTHIIWDFNGTLLNDMSAGIRAVNKMLAARRLREISGIDEYREVFRFPVIEYYRGLGFDFEREPFADKLAPEWVELYNIESRSSSLQAGALSALKAFRANGAEQILLSATEREMLARQTEELGIREYFSEVLGLGNIHAYSKKELALSWREQHPDALPLIIGDTKHDAEVAEAIGVDCLLVCNGHQSRRALLQCGVPIFDGIDEIIALLK